MRRLFDTYHQQDCGWPVTTLDDLEKMRALATAFAEQAAHLVQPRLIGGWKKDAGPHHGLAM